MDVNWEHLWARCIIDFGLSSEEAKSIDLVQYQLLEKYWRDKLIREDERVARICCMLANINAKKGAKRFNTEDFMLYKPIISEEQRLKRIEKELEKMHLAFTGKKREFKI